MPLTIPIQDDTPLFQQDTELDGVAYVLHFRYNQREKRFYLDVANTAGDDIYRGAALVCNWPLFRNQRTADMPPGILMVVPMGTDDSTPGLGELGPGKRCELWYFTLAELS